HQTHSRYNLFPYTTLFRSKDEQSDIVQGVVLMRRGEKSLPTLERVRQKVQALNNGILPNGMRIVPYYDRTNLINITTHTVTHTLDRKSTRLNSSHQIISYA